MKMIRWGMFFIGLAVFSLGISTTINVNHLGLHPWDVLSIAFFDKFGLSIGSWNIIIGVCFITVSFILDLSYVRIGTFLNSLIIGYLFVFYLWLDFLLNESYYWNVSVIILIGICVMRCV